MSPKFWISYCIVCLLDIEHYLHGTLIPVLQLSYSRIEGAMQRFDTFCLGEMGSKCRYRLNNAFQNEIQDFGPGLGGSHSSELDMKRTRRSECGGWHYWISHHLEGII
jgi:hypothetical protein